MYCMKKQIQRQTSGGPQVSSQGQRAAVVPLINRSSNDYCVPRFPDMPCMKRVWESKASVHCLNRLSTAGQPLVVFPHRFNSGFVCSCFRGVVQDSCIRCPGSPGRQRGWLLPGRTAPWASSPARSRPAPPPRRAPPRPDPPGVCPSFGIVRFALHGISFVRASRDSFRMVAFAVLEVEMEGRPLAEPLSAAWPRSRLAPPALPRLAPLRPHPPRHPALPVPPCPALPRPALGMSGFRIRQILMM